MQNVPDCGESATLCICYFTNRYPRIFSINSRISFRTVELIRGAHFHPACINPPRLICLVPFSYRRTYWRTLSVFFHEQSLYCNFPISFSDLECALSPVLCLYTHFEIFLPSLCVVNLLNARTNILLPHIVFLTLYISV